MRQPDPEVPFRLLETTSTSRLPLPPPTGAATLRICLIGPRGVVRPVERDATGTSSLPQLVTVLVEGPTLQERASGWTTAVAGPDLIGAIELDGGVATTELTDVFASLPADDQLGAVAQLVCTFTEQPGVGQVKFTRSGQGAEVPRGDGSSTSDPVSRSDYDNLIVSDG